MRKSLLLAAMVLPLAMLAKSPELTHQPEDLPAGIRSVNPVQGFVDISGSATPRGVSSIGINFGKTVMVNPDNTTPAELFWNDMTTPAATTLVTAIEPMLMTEGSVIFKGTTWNRNGSYKIVIPDGMFCYAPSVTAQGDTENDDESVVAPIGDPCPGCTLYYDIYVGYQVLPNPGVVPELDQVELFFQDADEVIITDKAKIDFYMDNAEGSLSINQKLGDLDNDGKNTHVIFTFGQGDISATIIEPGIYGINIPAGAYKYRIYGPNHATDPEDYIEYTSDEILLKYNLPSFTIPEIDPDPYYPVTGFDEFRIYIPEGFEPLWDNPDAKYIVNDKVASDIFSVNDNGVVDDSTPLVKARIKNTGTFQAPVYEGCTQYFITLYLYDAVKLDDELTEFKPANGQYCLRLGSSLFSGTFNGKFVTSDPFDYYYTVNNGSSAVKDIESVATADDEALTIYTLTGVLVAKNADASAISALAPGIYIVNGKKVLKK